MDTQTLHPLEMTEAHYKETHCPSSSIWRYSCLLSLLFLSLTVVTAAILIILFILKPKKPVFLLHSIQMDPLTLDIASIKDGYISLPVVSLLFVSQNPNKLGIRYSSTDLGVLYQSIPIGAIEVPNFYQPPCSGNVTIIMHASFDRLNVSRILVEESIRSASNGPRIDIQIIGSIRVQGHVFNFPLPRIKVSLDCRIDIDYADIAFSKEVNLTKVHKALFLSSFPHLTQKCSLALCI